MFLGRPFCIATNLLVSIGSNTMQHTDTDTDTLPDSLPESGDVRPHNVENGAAPDGQIKPYRPWTCADAITAFCCIWVIVAVVGGIHDALSGQAGSEHSASTPLQLMRKLKAVPAPVFKLNKQRRWAFAPVEPVFVDAQHEGIPYTSFIRHTSNPDDYIALQADMLSSERIYMPKAYKDVEVLHGCAPVCLRSLPSGDCEPTLAPCPIGGIVVQTSEYAVAYDRDDTCKGSHAEAHTS